MNENMDIKQNSTTVDHIERVSFPCSKCGKAAEADISIILTSDPLQYSYYCPYCGSHGSIPCSYVDQYQFYKKVWDAIESDSTHRAYCIICGKEISSVNKISDHYICENCKEAVIAMRKALGTWDD